MLGALFLFAQRHAPICWWLGAFFYIFFRWGLTGFKTAFLKLDVCSRIRSHSSSHRVCCQIDFNPSTFNHLNLDLASARTQRSQKTICYINNNCPIHCYKPDRREQVKSVMKYSGPRMIFKHPIFAIRHIIDGYKKAPPRGRRAAARKSET